MQQRVYHSLLISPVLRTLTLHYLIAYAFMRLCKLYSTGIGCAFEPLYYAQGLYRRQRCESYPGSFAIIDHTPVYQYQVRLAAESRVVINYPYYYGEVHEFNSNLLYFLHLECFYLLYHLIDLLECVILIHPRVKKRSEIKPINLISVLKS